MTPGANKTATGGTVAANPGAPGSAHSIHTHHTPNPSTCQDPLAEVLRCVAELARLYGDYDLYCALRRLFLNRQATIYALRLSRILNRIDAERKTLNADERR